MLKFTKKQLLNTPRIHFFFIICIHLHIATTYHTICAKHHLDLTYNNAHVSESVATTTYEQLLNTTWIFFFLVFLPTHDFALHVN